MKHDPMCPILAAYVGFGTPPAPHNCRFCKVSLPARDAERARIRAGVEALAAWYSDLDVVQRGAVLAVIDAASKDET